MNANASLLRNNRSGFTLVELMIVVAIISILSSIATVKMGESLAHARFARVEADMNVMRTAALQYYYDNDETYAPDTFPSVAPAFVPKYLKAWPTPPCAGWNYDWDAFDTMDASVVITLRNQGDAVTTGVPAGAIFTICVDARDIPDCSASIIGGIDIFQVQKHVLTCNE